MDVVALSSVVRERALPRYASANLASLSGPVKQTRARAGLSSPHLFHTFGDCRRKQTILESRLDQGTSKMLTATETPDGTYSCLASCT